MTENGNPSSYRAETDPHRVESVRVDPQPAQTHGVRASFRGVKQNVTSLFDAGKVMTRLGPKQLKDEIEIAKIELKEKGISLGKGAAVAAVGLVFGLFLLIALVSAAILGLGKVVEPWLAALIFAGIFLILMAIFVLIGVKMIKAQLPFKPEAAIFGVLYDLGVLKHGSDMTSKRVKREQAEKEEAKAAEKEAEKSAEEAEDKAKAPAAPAPTIDDLKQRTKQRREHMKSLRDDIDAYSHKTQAQAQAMLNAAKKNAKDTPTYTADASRRLVHNATSPQVVQSRWKSFTALLASVAAFFVFLGKLIKNR